jgi:prephenate dehydratase/chorismate mutase/prephenate dehydratase
MREEAMNLEDIRKNIDRLDAEILKLLNDRMEQALLAAKFKKRIEDSRREAAVLEGIKKGSTSLISREFLQGIYGPIIEESKKLQNKRYKLIAFQGNHGAYGEVAAREWDADLIPMPCRSFEKVFEGIKAGFFDYGIVPVENALGGVIGRVNELLISTDLNIVGAVELGIHHCLLALPETDHRELQAVYSHPQALAQCRRFLARNKLTPVHYGDTAGAAEMLTAKRPKACAAIASRSAAELYDLKIVKENIEDLATNMTRFLVLSKDENPEEGTKCSVVFSTEHKAGTLFRVLEVFARQGINLTRIESVPDKPGTYAFFVDFQSGSRDEAAIKAMEAAKAITRRFKLLGCYRERKVL